MYFVKSPALFKWYLPQLVWNKSRLIKTVYLTFDDGPTPIVTDFVLNTLKKHQVKATFFCIGDNITKHPDIFNRIKTNGHSIGNHTYHHLNGWKTDNQSYVSNFIKCQTLTNTPLFRPPYGRIKKSQVKLLSQAYQSIAKNTKPLQIIMWDCLSGDFDTQLSPCKCYLNVIKHIRNGSIIVFHDSLKAFERLEYALPKVLAYLKHQGYQFEVF